MKKHVLVTGGTGFTGSHLVKRLLKEGHAVHCVDVAPGLFDDDLRSLGATMTYGDIADAEFCKSIIGEAHTVYHLAAAFREHNAPRQRYWDVNVEGTRHLAQASQERGVHKFVYCSTQGVHGHVTDPPADESAPITPADYYQYTKYQGEVVINELVEHTGFDAVTVRPTAIYGPGDPERYLMLFKRCANGVFHMFGDGMTTYHPLYIDNLVDGFVRAAEAGRKGEAYLIGDAHYYTLNDLVRHVAAVMDVKLKIRHWPFRPLWCAAVACEAACYPLGIKPPIFRRRVDWFRQSRAFSIAKAQRDLGYQPAVDIHQGLSRTCQWYREHGYLPA